MPHVTVRLRSGTAGRVCRCCRAGELVDDLGKLGDMARQRGDWGTKCGAGCL